MRFSGMTQKDVVAYFDSISIKPYDSAFGCKEPGEKLPPIADVLEMNRDMEPFVIQSGATVTPLLRKTAYEPLQFVHFSDIHAVKELWNRIVEFINHYSDYIAFALHTGDYCGDNQLQYRDLYAEGTPCVKPILNCVGNHDTVTGADWCKTGKDLPHSLLFSHTENWNTTFMDVSDSMTYYRDFPDSNVRFIVLDQYYDQQMQIVWLQKILREAKEKGYWVITAMHEPTAAVTEVPDTTFHSVVDFAPCPESVFESVLAEYIGQGGNYICNLCGHEHHDLFGYTDRGVLNVAVECACDWAGWCDGRRVRGTKTYDCFNVVTVDTDHGLLKLVRIGNPCDYFLRHKQVLCFDYRKRKVIFNK